MSSTLLTQELYFTTSTVIDWMDVFTRPLYKHIILESLEYCQANKGLDLYAWVLMTNHLHLIVGVNGGNTIGEYCAISRNSPAKALSRPSKKMNRKVGKNG